MSSHTLEVSVSPSLYNRLWEAVRRSPFAMEAWVRRVIEERLERESGSSHADALAPARASVAPRSTYPYIWIYGYGGHDRNHSHAGSDLPV